MTVAGTKVFKDAKVCFKNLAGKPGAYNAAGQRNFHVILDTKEAEEMEKEGWPIKWFEPREEGDERQAHMKVSARFDNIPPDIYLVSADGKRKNKLSEDDLMQFDASRVIDVDMVVTPYNWSFNGKTGVKAYLKKLWFKIDMDELEAMLEDKYFDVPDSLQNTIGGCGHCDACDGDCDHA